MFDLPATSAFFNAVLAKCVPVSIKVKEFLDWQGLESRFRNHSHIDLM